MSHHSVRLKAFLVFLLCVIFLYVNSLNAPFYFDDRPNILNNLYVQMEELAWPPLERLLRENFFSGRAIPYISFGINYLTGGFHPFGYHIFNVIIHLLNACLVHLFAFKTFSLPSLRLGRGHVFQAALLAAFLWAVHPIQTNAATYIVQRMTSLSAMFFLLSFLAYIQGRLSWKDSMKKSMAWFLSSVLLGVSSLACKENTAFLPFLILAYDCMFFRGAYPPRRKFLWGLLAAALLLLAMVEWFGGMSMITRVLNNYAYRDFTLQERLLTEMRVVFHYLGQLLVPDPERLTLYYDSYPISRSFFNPWSTAVSFLGLILAALSIFFSISSKSPVVLIYAFGALWYFVNLIMESSFLGLELVFEHRAYLPSIGIFLIMSFWIVRLKSIFTKQKHYVNCFLALFIFLELFGTVLRNQYWSNKAAFHQHALDMAPESIRVLSSLSLVYIELGDMQASREFLEKALEKKPDDIYLLAGYFLMLKDFKMDKEAEQILFKIDGLVENGEYRYRVTDILGLQELAEMFYDKEKDYKNAIKYLNYIIRIDKITINFFKLGVGYLNLNQPEKALDPFKKSIERKPDVAEYNFFLGLAYKMLGRDREAVPYVKRALELSPRPALIKDFRRIMSGRVWSEKRPIRPWAASPRGTRMILPE